MQLCNCGGAICVLKQMSDRESDKKMAFGSILIGSTDLRVHMDNARGVSHETERGLIRSRVFIVLCLPVGLSSV